MSIYKRYSDKTKCIDFVMKVEKVFDKYLKIYEEVSIIIKEINSELVYNKKIPKS